MSQFQTVFFHAKSGIEVFERGVHRYFEEYGTLPYHVWLSDWWRDEMEGVSSLIVDDTVIFITYREKQGKRTIGCDPLPSIPA